MRVALAAIIFIATSQLRAAAASAVSVLPPIGGTLTYVVTETKRDFSIPDNKDQTSSDTITLIARADSSFDTVVSYGTLQHELNVKPWSGNTLETTGTVVGSTFWAQDINAVISLLSGHSASLTNGAYWTTQPVADTTAIQVPDMSRQKGTTALLIPLLVHVTKSGDDWRVEGESTGDQGNGPTVLAVATVKTAAVFSGDGKFLHGEGSVKYGLPHPVAGSDAAVYFFTRSWTVDLKR